MCARRVGVVQILHVTCQRMYQKVFFENVFFFEKSEVLGVQAAASVLRSWKDIDKARHCKGQLNGKKTRKALTDDRSAA